jgi:DNA-binding response OmpR family regulator
MEGNKIIICDDDQDNLDVLEILLQLEGCTVIKENDSSKLIEKIKSESPDMLFIELWMPIISGTEIIKSIRENSDIYKLFIAGFSASSNGEKAAYEAGADYYVSKPFNINEILEVIEKAMIITR